MGISIRAYARHRGVTDTAVHKAIRTGRITPEADGTIDADRADADDESKAGGRGDQVDVSRSVDQFGIHQRHDCGGCRELRRIKLVEWCDVMRGHMSLDS